MEQFIQTLNFVTIKDWLMISILALLVVNLVSFKQLRKKQEGQQLLIQSLENNFKALANSAIGLGESILNVERQQRTNTSVTNLYKQPTNSTYNSPVDFYDSPNQPYEKAIRLAQSDVSVDDIMRACGLSQSEVELICMMHRLDKVS